MMCSLTSKRHAQEIPREKRWTFEAFEIPLVTLRYSRIRRHVVPAIIICWIAVTSMRLPQVSYAEYHVCILCWICLLFFDFSLVGSGPRFSCKRERFTKKGSATQRRVKCVKYAKKKKKKRYPKMRVALKYSTIIHVVVGGLLLVMMSTHAWARLYK